MTDDADHLARHQAVDCLVARLLDDRYLVPGIDDARQVRIERVVRHAGQRHPLRRPHVARRQNDVARRGHLLRVLVERFVEIAQAEEDNRIGKLFLDLEVLLAEGCGHQTQ